MKRAIVCGVHGVRLALERRPAPIRIWVQARRDDKRIRALLARARQVGVPVETVSRAALDRLSDGVRHQGVVGEITTEARERTENDFENWVHQAVDPFILILDGIEDPRNLGACLRSANATGVDAVVLPRRRSAGLTPAARKTASGAAEQLDVYTVTNLSRALCGIRDAGVHIVGTVPDTDAIPPWKARLLGPVAIALGSEAHGLRRLTRQHCDELVSLPMYGVVESLNVAVTCGVMLYEALHQRMVA